MAATMENPPPAKEPLSNRQVDTIRGQYHAFALIPVIAAHTRWFDAGLVCLAVEARALGDSAERMVRGPSIHVFDAGRRQEFLRFDVFGRVLHYHYIHPETDHNTLWGYDPDTNGPMIPWVVAALRDRLPAMLRRAGAEALAAEVEEQGWDTSVLPDVERAANAALAPRDDDLARAKEGMDWMMRWKAVHPQFNTVGEGAY
ncbi:hypothetical protein B2G71_14305 [Novosphingobium sp. PC22D]|uniref:DUF7700 domain-containing protein n=1 Tax=Novosphingobium sp. PC22D TaxID=1962403 RepID=UPI000BF2292C|nr:hypothetical protein [Novosphingobium sp. PC22D]PEQ11949.1 hypothetical protein B2G71_14305 [Novosphingobium sp. PC22D]